MKLKPKFGFVFLPILASFFFGLYSCQSLHFDDEVKLVTYVEGPKGSGWDLWRGTFYCGNKDGKSFFSHQLDLFPDKRLILNSGEWVGDQKMRYTNVKSKWISWDELEVTTHSRQVNALKADSTGD